MTASARLEELIPLHGTPRFATLTERQKQTLYLEFIQLNAEGSMLFEQLLLLGFRKLRTRPEFDGVAGQAAQKLVYEEFEHSRAFHQFLRSEPAFNWPHHKVMIGGQRLRRWLTWVTARAPLALCVWGVKIESFSVYYAQYLKALHGSWDTDRWTKLHQYHLLDEGNHVPIQLDLYRRNFFRGITGEALALLPYLYLLVALVQVLLFRGCWGMVTSAFPEHSKFQRIRLTLNVARWSVRKLAPYRQARQKARGLFAHKQPPLRPFVSFMNW